MISGNIGGEVGLLALPWGKKRVPALLSRQHPFPFLVLSTVGQYQRDVQVALVGPALAVPVPVDSFSVLVKGWGCCGMENALLYLLQNLIYYFFLYNPSRNFIKILS